MSLASKAIGLKAHALMQLMLHSLNFGILIVHGATQWQRWSICRGGLRRNGGVRHVIDVCLLCCVSGRAELLAWVQRSYVACLVVSSG